MQVEFDRDEQMNKKRRRKWTKTMWLAKIKKTDIEELCKMLITDTFSSVTLGRSINFLNPFSRLLLVTGCWCRLHL